MICRWNNSLKNQPHPIMHIFGGMYISKCISWFSYEHHTRYTKNENWETPAQDKTIRDARNVLKQGCQQGHLHEFICHDPSMHFNTQVVWYFFLWKDLRKESWWWKMSSSSSSMLQFMPIYPICNFESGKYFYYFAKDF